MLDPKLQDLITARQKDINKNIGDIAASSFTLGAHSSEDKIIAIFATLKANINNEKMSDKDFRMFTGQFLDGLDNLVNERK